MSLGEKSIRLNVKEATKDMVRGLTEDFEVNFLSGGELLEIQLLDNHLLNTFRRKSTARHKIYQLLESG